MRELINHILAMKDDAYLNGHPEWKEIVKEAEMFFPKENKLPPKPSKPSIQIIK